MIYTYILYILSFFILVLFINLFKYGSITYYIKRIREKFLFDIRSYDKALDIKKWNTSFRNKVSTVDLEKLKLQKLGNDYNIVFVTYDGRRHDDFNSSKENGVNDMPFFNSLISKSIFFNNAVSTNVWSFPSQSSMYTGLPPQIFRNDSLKDEYHNTFPNITFSISEILKQAGYHTINIADHPQNLFKSENGTLPNSFARGFDLIDVVGFYPDLKLRTNLIGKSSKLKEIDIFNNKVHLVSNSDVRKVENFNSNGFESKEPIQFDKCYEDNILYPKISNSYGNSSFFNDRYSHIFKRLFDTNEINPFFLSLNLHFCDIAIPDDKLLAHWCLDFLILNSDKREKELPIPEEGTRFSKYFKNCLKNILELDYWKVKHHFDNRFYDYTFKRFYLEFEKNDIIDKTIFVITSDHGFGFGENGEERYLHGGARPYHYLTDVPLIINLPESHSLNNLNGLYEKRVSLIDLFYTIVDLSGYKGLWKEGIKVYLNEDEVYEEIDELKISFGKSLIHRIQKDDFSDYIISEQKVKPVYYNERPYSKGLFVSVQNKKYKLIFCPEAITECVLKINFNANIVLSKDNIFNLLYLLNPLNMFLPRKRQIKFLFDTEIGESTTISNPEVERELLKAYNDYKLKSDIIENIVHSEVE